MQTGFMLPHDIPVTLGTITAKLRLCRGIDDQLGMGGAIGGGIVLGIHRRETTVAPGAADLGMLGIDIRELADALKVVQAYPNFFRERQRRRTTASPGCCLFGGGWLQVQLVNDAGQRRLRGVASFTAIVRQIICRTGGDLVTSHKKDQNQ